MLSCLRRVSQLIVLGHECCRDLSHCRQVRMRHSTSVCLVLTVQQRGGSRMRVTFICGLFFEVNTRGCVVTVIIERDIRNCCS